METHKAHKPTLDSILILGEKNGAHVSIRFAEDNLTVWADFYPPTPKEAPLSANAVIETLMNLNVVYGILHDGIQNAVRDCNLNHQILQEVPVARGDPPERDVLEYFERNPGIRPKVPAEPKGNGRIDYHAFSPFTIVKKGQILASLKPRRQGRNGKDIHGNVIAYGTLTPEGVTAGENTHSDQKYIYADIDGQFLEEKGVLRVQDSLVIKGKIDYHTGNIVFPGDITIEGPVSDGFTIYSGGALTIKQTFDVTNATVKSDLSVAGGIIGRGRAMLKAGGEIKTKFIENCRVACRKTISVETGIVNSSVYTMDRIEMGEKGMILSSEVYAARGVSTSGIGKKSGKATRIHCGIDFTALQEQDRLNHNLRNIGLMLARIERLMSAEKESGGEGGGRLKKMEEAAKKLQAEQQKISAALIEVLKRLNTDENACVEVRGQIAPGTLIEICQIALFVTEPLDRVRLSLDRAAGKIVTGKLEKR